MVAVSFLRFATAVMDLLEPASESGGAGEAVVGQMDELSDTPFVSIEDLHSEQGQIETVEAVAANLTKAISSSSSEKLVQAAETIKEFTTENSLPKSELQSLKEPQDAVQLVKDTVAVLASKTVQEIKEVKGSIDSIKQLSGEKTIDIDQADKTASFTEELTEKLQEKIVENSSKSNSSTLISIAVNSANNEFENIKDFWKSIEEADPSKIIHYEAVSYLYNYMTDRSLLNIFDPKFDRKDRVEMFTGVMNSASDASTVEIITNYLNQNHDYFRRTTSSSDRDFSRKDEMRDQEARRQAELLGQLRRSEQQKLDNQLISERTKASLDSQS